MSIFSDAAARKITFGQAGAEIVGWISKVFTSNAIASSAGVAVENDLKQAASNAIQMGGTLLGPIMVAAGGAVETAANAAITSAIGPLAGQVITPFIDHGLQVIEDALVAEVKAAMLATRAKLTLPPPTQPSGG